jgi:GNAT superfamily N-acetyltransferase
MRNSFMPFAARHRNDPIPALTPLSGFSVRREVDPRVMANLQRRSVDEMTRRFEAGHRAYVALIDGESAAWGWVATRSAEIGELNTAFVISAGERYLWNFVTLEAYRGRGIYPRLLEAIINAESAEAERFWIAYAPENRASGAGILRAGFVALAELSFAKRGRAALSPLIAGGAAVAARVLGLHETSERLTPCWRCVRAGRPNMFCADGSCECDYQRPNSGCAA